MESRLSLSAKHGIVFPKGAATPLRMRCPGCHQLGSFEKLAGLEISDVTLNDQVGTGKFRAVQVGHRFCPDPKCKLHVFVIHISGVLLKSYPPELIDFDSKDIPAGVNSAFEEALICHANECYVAAAMLVRKTLEELCQDRGAKGANLRERIQNLRSLIVVPEELFQALDDIRLLGNDAAHIESQNYNDVGKEEVELAITFTQEILKGVYQYADLLKQLRALKK